jgi:hypothetical protein
MDRVSELSISDIAVTGHTPVRIDCAGTVATHYFKPVKVAAKGTVKDLLEIVVNLHKVRNH